MLIKNNKSIKIFYIILICLLYVEIIYAQQSKKSDSLINILNTAKDDTTKIRIRYEIGNLEIINRIGYFDSLRIDCEKLLLSNSKQNTKKTIKKYLANDIFSIARIYYNQDKFPIALEYFHKGLKISEEIGFNKGIIFSLIDIGDIYRLQEDIPKAFEYYLRSLKLSEESGEKTGIEKASNDVGVQYLKQENPRALEYFNKCLKVNKDIKNKVGISYCYKNIGILYFIMAKKAVIRQNALMRDSLINKSLEYFFKYLKVSEANKDNVGIANYYRRIGEIYFFLAKEMKSDQNYLKRDSLIKKSLDCYYKSLKLYEKYGDKPDNVTILLDIGELFYYKNEYLIAFSNALKAYKISIESGNLNRIEQSSELLKRIYNKKGDYKNAYEYYQIEIKMRDSLINVEQLIYTQKQQAKYEYGKKEAIDSIASSKTLEIKNLVIGKQKVIIYFFICGFVVILIFLIIIFQLFFQKRKANFKLAQQNKEIMMQKEEITSHRDEIEAQRDMVRKQNELLAKQKEELNEKKIITEQENSILKIKNIEAEIQHLKQQIQPHFLFNSLYTLKTLIVNNNKAEEYLLKLCNLLRISLSSDKINIIKLKDEVNFCFDYLEMQKIRFGNALHYSINISEEIQNTGFVLIFSLQQLIENAIKHNAFTEELPLVIKVVEENGRIIVNNNIRNKLMTEVSTGLGLANITERYKILTGDKVIINKTENEFSVSVKILNNENSYN